MEEISRARSAQVSLRKPGLLPFEKLPNLPKPKIPIIDLGIESSRTTDIKAIA